MNWCTGHKRLSQAGLIQRVDEPEHDFRVRGVTQDSRQVVPDGIFVAIRGTMADGHDFIAHAIDRGARGIVCERIPKHANHSDVHYLLTKSARKALAELAAAFYKDPGEQLHLTGVTGTNGKTTTSTLIRHVLEITGTHTGLISSVVYTHGTESQAATLTTPDAPQLQRFLSNMVTSGCNACVMEVSSHALSQERVGGLSFDVAVFTNLMHDHLDFHGTMDRYLRAKKNLFDNLSKDAVAVYNIDDYAGHRMVADTRATRCAYGKETDAHVRFTVLEDNLSGLRLRLDGTDCTFRLAGTFNAYNLAAAYAAARTTGLQRSTVLDALCEAPPVPGRFEQFVCGDGTLVVIDFAHTPDALQGMLEALQTAKPSGAHVWCIFGCGGDRDQAKRPLMGRVAERFADRVIVTSDNPRSENPQAIADAILQGLQTPSRATWIADRRDAVHYVARNCVPGDIVLVAGRGHETTQIVQGRAVTLNDRDEVQLAFAARGIQNRAS